MINLKTFEEYMPFIPGNPGNFGEEIILDDLTIGQTSNFLDSVKGKKISFWTDGGFSFPSKSVNKIEIVRDVEIDCGEDYPGNDAPTSYCSLYINDFKVDTLKNIEVID